MQIQPLRSSGRSGGIKLVIQYSLMRASVFQGSIKIIIPSSNSESISHGIFYTAITRTKKNLKIYWSADTMQKIIGSFNVTEQESCSLELIMFMVN